MSNPHKQFLRMRMHLDHLYGSLPADDYKLVVRYGHWYQALVMATIQPNTPEQIRFIEVAHKKKEPETKHEMAWSRYCVAQLEYAKNAGKSGVYSGIGFDDWREQN